MSKVKKLQTNSWRPTAPTDWWLMVLTAVMIGVGMVFVFDASVAEAYYQLNDKYYFVIRQVRWAAAGLLTLLIASRIPMAWIRRYAKMFFLLAMIALVMVLIPGLGSKIQGARRWLSLGILSFQPSELIKLAIVTYYPTWLIDKPSYKVFVGLTGLIVMLLILEPDLGTTLVVAVVSITLFYLAGTELRRIAILGIIGIAVVISLIVVSPYRRERLMTFMDPTQDPLDSSYHIRQVLISLGSGGIWGTGFGRSRQKFQFLPEATTDSIFAVIAEETGFIGAMVVISLFAWLTYRATMLTQKITAPYPRLLAGGVTTWITAQALLNLGAMTSLLPLTGVPLPFISYGGSALVTIMTAMGLLLNASRYRKL